MAHNYDFNLINTPNNITMKNDPVINAPISKIVEAIESELKKVLFPIDYDRAVKSVTEALASLGGDEPKGEWYCPKCEGYLVGEQVTFEEYHATCGTAVFVKQSHPSEREVLIDFEKWDICYDKQTEDIQKTILPSIIDNINRYLNSKKT